MHPHTDFPPRSRARAAGLPALPRAHSAGACRTQSTSVAIAGVGTSPALKVSVPFVASVKDPMSPAAGFGTMAEGAN